MKTLLAALLLAFGQLASAAVICSLPCGDYQDQAAGTFLGAFDPATRDVATFQHTTLAPNLPFEDFWVFDLTADGSGSVSADFTAFAAIRNFSAALYRDDGSTCDGVACAEVVLGELIAESVDTIRRFEILMSELSAGRYILSITGLGSDVSVYTGQMGFGTPISEPATAGLFMIGVFGTISMLTWLAFRRKTGERK